MISIKEKEEHLKKLNSELDSKRNAMMQQLNQIKTDQEKNMTLSDQDGAEVEAEEANDNYDDPEDFGADRDSLEEGGRGDYGDEEEEENIYKEKNIEEQLHDLKKRDEIQRIKQFDQLKEENEENERTIQIQKAKIETLVAEVEKMAHNLRLKESYIEELESKGKNISEESKKYVNQVTSLMEKLEDTKKELSQQTQKLQLKDKEIQNLKKENDNLQRNAKKVEGETSKKDVKINRLQEELDKVKIEIKQQRVMVDDKTDDVKKQYDKIIQENRKLERQRNELLQAFKKQLKLIDVLKRQKTHLEAAKMLNFTEEEFIKALDLADKIN